jgi:class 3 adenylate cyclase
MQTGGRLRTERRLDAILAADIAGYSRLIGADEEGTLERLRSIREAVDGHPRHRRSERLGRLAITPDFTCQPSSHTQS